MKFRIVEYNDVSENKKTFLVQTGTKTGSFFKKKTVWEYAESPSFETFSEALNCIEKIKRQMPIYHKIK